MARFAMLVGTYVGVFGFAATQAWGQFGVPISQPAPLSCNASCDTSGDVFPSVTTDGQGNWVAVWHSQPVDDAVEMRSTILVARSSDNGTTWTAPVPLNAEVGAATTAYLSPQVATDGQGTWITTWTSADPAFVSDFGAYSDILAARSLDNGATWSAPILLNTHSGDSLHGESSLATDRQGNWVVVWRSNDPAVAGGIGADFDILMVRSSDNGATWSGQVPLNSTADNDAATDLSPHVSADRQGNWVATWHSHVSEGIGVPGTDVDILVARSTDNGQTWTVPALLNANASDDTGNDYAPRVTTDGQGNWVAVWVSYGRDVAGGTGTGSDISVARSSDNGATWTVPMPLNAAAGDETPNESESHVTTDGRGNWVAVWQSAVPGMASNIMISHSLDNGATWTTPAPLDNNVGRAQGHHSGPQIATDTHGNWVVVWFSGDPNIANGIGTDGDILVARFSLPECEPNGDVVEMTDVADSCPDLQAQVEAGDSCCDEQQQDSELDGGCGAGMCGMGAAPTLLLITAGLLLMRAQRSS